MPKCEVCLKENAEFMSFFCANCEAWLAEIILINETAEVEVLSPFEETYV